MNDNLSCLSLDAINAFGSISREEMYKLIKEKIPDMLQWFLFLYGDGIQVQFDAIHSLEMLGGAIQGLTSSNLYYSAMKWAVQQNAQQQMEMIEPDFIIDFQMDYIDDGLQLIMDKYVSDYAKILIEIYTRWNIRIHPGKSTIIINTNDERRKTWFQDAIPQFTITTDGCFTFLGVPHGNEANHQNL